ncbi:hypothetical protein V1264_005035 [Littorina saxatilis]|uniref:MADF domain-containing protein n=2 Tax=Littorina saxatilis TaxID=31220 RepID=A0AAN9AYP6_9CAEN
MYNMAVSNYRFSSTQIGELIDLYRSHEPLWNTFSKLYKNRDAKFAAWQSVQMNFQAKYGVLVSMDDIEKRLVHERTLYVRELKKVQNTTRSGAGGDDVYLPTGEFYHELSFLAPVVKLRKSITNLVGGFY